MSTLESTHVNLPVSLAPARIVVPSYEIQGEPSWWGRWIRAGEAGRESHRMAAESRHAPILGLLAYYAGLIAVATLFGDLFPLVRDSIVLLEEPGGGGELADLLRGGDSGSSSAPFASLLERAFSSALVTVGALLLVFPVAWVYMRTKRLRYDPSLVQSLIMLPIVVAGILMVAKNSVAVAFGVVGIVAAVRFRNTLSDPKDAVYIFLALAIGVAAGVQALDVALVTSFAFNLVILALWRYNVGSIYGGAYGRTGTLAIGETDLMLARARLQRQWLRLHLRKKAKKIGADGLLLVHTAETKSARRAVEELLDQDAKDWRLAEVVAREDGYSTLEYLLRLKRKSDPVEFVTDLDEHASAQIAAVEYLPLKVPA